MACGGFGCGGAFGGGGLVVVACRFVGDTVVAKVVAAAVGCCIGYCSLGEGDRCSPCVGYCIVLVGGIGGGGATTINHDPDQIDHQNETVAELGVHHRRQSWHKWILCSPS